jgi:hypothetical protein
MIILNHFNVELTSLQVMHIHHKIINSEFTKQRLKCSFKYPIYLLWIILNIYFVYIYCVSITNFGYNLQQRSISDKALYP